MSTLGPDAEIDGRYRIIERKAAGSMGVVFLAEDIWLSRSVAIKMIDAAQAGDEASAKMFWQEARALAQIRHENIVHVYTFGKHEGNVFFAMEFIDGQTLESIIEEHQARGEQVDLGRAQLILRAIAQGLGAVHDRHLVHRDVKPGNIVIEKGTGRPVLVDFGLARRVKSSSQPKIMQTAGTPMYMPPEQARDVDGTQTTAASDLYAFACTAFELFTGRPLFEGEDIYEVLSAHLNEPPPLISTIRPELEVLDRVFARALAKGPEHRHPGTIALMNEIDEALKEVLEPRSSLVRAARPDSRRPSKDAVRLFILEGDDGLARQIVRAADRALEVPAIEVFTGASDLVTAFERFPADIVMLDEDTSTSSLATVVQALRRLNGGQQAEVIVLSRSWERAGPSSLASLKVRELPKPINMQVLGSVLRSAGARTRSTPPASP